MDSRLRGRKEGVGEGRRGEEMDSRLRGRKAWRWGREKRGEGDPIPPRRRGFLLSQE